MIFTRPFFATVHTVLIAKGEVVRQYFTRKSTLLTRENCRVGQWILNYNHQLCQITHIDPKILKRWANERQYTARVFESHYQQSTMHPADSSLSLYYPAYILNPFWLFIERRKAVRKLKKMRAYCWPPPKPYGYRPSREYYWSSYPGILPCKM